MILELIFVAIVLVILYEFFMIGMNQKAREAEHLEKFFRRRD
ncbi:MAG: hypothetical protein AABW59_01035 [archaeon]